jgi:RNA polymerase sigma-70 factor, ECF subfamily
MLYIMNSKSWDKMDVKLLRENDPSVWKRFITEHHTLVYSLASSFTQNEEERKDLCMEIFSKVFQSISGFKQESKLSTWFYRIAYNHLINFSKKAKNNCVSITDMLDDYEDDLASDDCNPLEDIDLERSQALLKSSIDSLPMKYRTAIVLYYYEDKDYKQVAEIMQMPLGTVKTILFRAKQMMRTQLQPLLLEAK